MCDKDRRSPQGLEEFCREGLSNALVAGEGLSGLCAEGRVESYKLKRENVPDGRDCGGDTLQERQVLGQK